MSLLTKRTTIYLEPELHQALRMKSVATHLRRDIFLFVILSFRSNLVFAGQRFERKLRMTEKPYSPLSRFKCQIG